MDTFLLIKTSPFLPTLSTHSLFFPLSLSTSRTFRSKFAKLFFGHTAVVVNVSSLLAVQPFDGWGCYATAKAARDHFHRVLACEVGAKLLYDEEKG